MIHSARKNGAVSVKKPSVVNTPPASKKLVNGKRKIQLSPEFSGLTNDSMLEEIFDALHDLSDFSYRKSMWDLSYKLEQAMDEVLLHKDRLDRGVMNFSTARSLVDDKSIS